MTLDEFVEKYNGKKIDYDGAYGAQCVDVFRQYCKDVLSIPHTGAVVGAEELFTKYDVLPLEQKCFERLPYPAGKAQAGDAVIFCATENNPYGHVAIVVSAEDTTLTVFEQDGFKQDGAHIATRGYGRVLGFLRKKA